MDICETQTSIVVICSENINNMRINNQPTNQTTISNYSVSSKNYCTYKLNRKKKTLEHYFDFYQKKRR